MPHSQPVLVTNTLALHYDFACGCFYTVHAFHCLSAWREASRARFLACLSVSFQWSRELPRMLLASFPLCGGPAYLVFRFPSCNLQDVAIDVVPGLGLRPCCLCPSSPFLSLSLPLNLLFFSLCSLSLSLSLSPFPCFLNLYQ